MAFGVHRLFRRSLAAWWTLAVGLAVTGALGWEMHREAVKMDRQRLAMRVAEVTAQLDARIEKSEMLLHNLRDYLMLSGETRNSVFDRWCYENGLTINCPWLHCVAVATNRHVVSWPSEVPKPSSDWTTNDLNALLAFARAHPIECDIALLSTVTNTLRFLADYDLRGAHQERNKLFSRAVENSRLGMSEHRIVMLDAQSNAIAGTFFQAPIYRPEMSGLMVDLTAAGWTKPSFYGAVRWLYFSSIIISPVDFNMLTKVIWDEKPADLGVELFSSTNQTAATWLNVSGDTPRAADPNFKAYLTHRQLWPMYAKKFSIFFHTTPLFEAQSPRRLARISMIAGTALTLLATALVGVALRARNQQESMTEQIREARDALAAAQQERNKISRDLHDGTIQSLYAIQLGLGHTIEKLEGEPAKAGRELSAVRREVDTVIAEIRQFITSLVTAEAGAGKPVDFCAVLQALVQRARPGTPAQIELHCDSAASVRLTSDQAVQLANIAREALSNSLRHAKPRRVQIALRSEPKAVVLEISDDGAGFDPKAPGRTGVGLTNMMTRAREMGGALEIQSSPGVGARIQVRVPANGLEPIGAKSPSSSTNES